MHSRNVADSEFLSMIFIFSSTINRFQLQLFSCLYIRFRERSGFETHYCALKMECNDQSYRRWHTFFRDAYSTPLPYLLPIFEHFEVLNINSESHMPCCASVDARSVVLPANKKPNRRRSSWGIQNKHISIVPTENLARFIFFSVFLPLFPT